MARLTTITRVAPIITLDVPLISLSLSLSFSLSLLLCGGIWGSKRGDCDIWGRVRNFLAGNSYLPLTRKGNWKANLKNGTDLGNVKSVCSDF